MNMIYMIRHYYSYFLHTCVTSICMLFVKLFVNLWLSMYNCHLSVINLVVAKSLYVDFVVCVCRSAQSTRRAGVV